MNKSKINSITIIGTGNVAKHLAIAFVKAGKKICQVYGRDSKKVRHISVIVDAQGITDPSRLSGDADLYLLALSDSAYTEVLDKIQAGNKLIAHTSGTLPLSILKYYSPRYGVFYPLQTLSKDIEIDLKNVPILVESNSTGDEEILFSLGSEISDFCLKLNSEKRKIVHLAAVFSCNFSNYLYAVAFKILNDNQIDTSLLRPLIIETANKVTDKYPEDVQTGPAARADMDTIREHLHLLSVYPEYSEVYRLLSELILEKHNPKRNRHEEL